MPKIPPELGQKVTTRSINYSDLAERAWGSEFRAPDHGIYRFGGGRDFDSTDRNRTGIYGVVGDDSIIVQNPRYPDMRDALNLDFGPGLPNASLNQPTGSFDELGLDNSPITYPFAAPLPEVDPYFAYVAMLLHGDAFTDSGPLAVPITGGAGQVIAGSSVLPAFLGNRSCFYQPSLGSNNVIGNTGAGWTGIQQTAFEPFTFEMSLYCVAYPASTANILGAQTTDKYWYIDNTGRMYIGSWGAGLTFNDFLNGPLPLNRWVQIAVTYDGNASGTGALRGFLDGVLKVQSSGALVAATVADNFSLFEIPGAAGGTGPIFRGGRKEIRYTKGVQRYGVNYTPRTTPFPNS